MLSLIRLTFTGYLLLLVVTAAAHGAEATNAFHDGVKNQRAGKYKEAIAAYDRAIKADPKGAEAYVGRGSALAKTGQHERALKDYDEALRLNANLADAYYLRGNAHNELKKYADAVKDYDEALRRNPKSSDAYHNRGVAYFR